MSSPIYSTAGSSSTLLKNQLSADRRLHTRITDRRSTCVRRGVGFGTHEVAGTLVDISRGGLQLLVPEPVTPGEWISFDLPVAREPGLPMGKMRGRVLRSTERDSPEGVNYALGVVFSNPALGFLPVAWDRIAPWCALGMMALITANVMYLKHRNLDYFWYAPWSNLYALLVSLYILSRIVLACFYRPPRLVGYLPTVSVIIACKNEEHSIYRTIVRIFASHYPREKVQVIAINDGSTDTTLAEMRRAQLEHPGLKIIDFTVNQGKRHGMAAGARAATGDILVYVDSDSFIRRDALRQIVAGFIDPEVGAVCGHAYAENARQNLLTKMQEVRYYVAFRIVKAAESIFSAVSCCSGCLAAYRRTYLMDVLDVWLNQRFLGTTATFGDDRSMTNFMLRRWRVIYNSEAVCTTIVPDNWRVFLRQQLRWKKSWIRESLIGLGFMWKRHPIAAFFFYCGVMFPLVSPLVVIRSVIMPLLGSGSLSLLYAYGTLIMAILYGLVYAARFRNRVWIYGIFFSFFYMVVLVWQTYYALVTVRRNHWGTR